MKEKTTDSVRKTVDSDFVMRGYFSQYDVHIIAYRKNCVNRR